MMENIGNYISLFIVVIAFGGYVVVIERRLTRIEVTLKFLQTQLAVLMEKLSA